VARAPRPAWAVPLRALSPCRWLVQLRDAYVSAMLRLATSPAVGRNAGVSYSIPPRVDGPTMAARLRSRCYDGERHELAKP
jgi:hypothetical protein